MERLRRSLPSKTREDRHSLWSAKIRSVATQPPARAHIHDASRRVRISSQPDIRQSACVCARWAGPVPTRALADRDLTTNVASQGYSGWSSPESSFCRWRSLNGSKSRDIRAGGCRPVARIPSSPLGLALAFCRTRTPRFLRPLVDLLSEDTVQIVDDQAVGMIARQRLPEYCSVRSAVGWPVTLWWRTHRDSHLHDDKDVQGTECSARTLRKGHSGSLEPPDRQTALKRLETADFCGYLSVCQ